MIFKQASIRRLNTRSIEYLDELRRDQGDLAVCYLGRQRVVYVSEPKLARRLLIGHAAELPKFGWAQRWWLRRPTYTWGAGEVFKTHDPHRHREARRVMQPLVSRHALAETAEGLAAAAHRTCVAADGQLLDLYHFADVLLFVMATHVFLEVELELDEASDFVRTITLAQEKVSRETFRSSTRKALSLLSHPRASLHQGQAFLAIRPQVEALIARAPEERIETLSRALTAAHANDLTFRIGRLFITSLGAPAGLTMALMHVTEPTYSARFRAEAECVLADGRLAPGTDVFTDLPLARAATLEGLRLGPTALQVSRTCARPFTAEGFDFARGDFVVVSPFQVHRDPRYYEDPLSFRPDRWLSEPAVDSEAYFPFGLGARKCLGADLVDATMTIVTAVAAADWRVETETRLEDLRWQVKPSGDVKPRDPIMGTISPQPRRGAAATEPRARAPVAR